MRTACTLGSSLLAASLMIAPLPRDAAAMPLPASPQQAQPASSNDALMVYSAGVDALLVDPKDAGLLRALKMLDERILELPRELDDDEMPAPAIELALQLLMSPMSLRAGMLDMNAEPQGPPFYGQISFYGSADAAANFAGRVRGLLAEVGAPPPSPAADMPGMQMVDADGVPMYFGTMKSGDQGSAFVIGVNKVGSPVVNLDNTGLPRDVKPALAFMLDARKLQPVMDMLMAQAGPEADMLEAQLSMSGMYGPDAGQIIAAIGHGKDRAHGWGTFTNYRKAMEKAGMVPTTTLKSADFKRVPGDATYAEVGKLNISGLMNLFAEMAAEGMKQEGVGGEEPDPFQFVADSTGIHPQRDIADHLGETWGMYMSDTTGGGGLSSLVGFFEVKNAEGLSATMSRIRGMINQIAQDQARGYVRVGETTMNDQKVMTLMFPGLPVPLELCWTIADGWLYAAASPNALSAAIAQGRSGSNSLYDNSRFKDMGGHDLDDAMQVSFLDTPRMMRSGYGMLSMGMSALANAVRSPSDPKRDAGLIMPSFNELSKDAKATVTIVRLSGDDLVMTSQGDRSMLVNAAGAVGAIGGMTGVFAAAAMAGGITMPAMAKARESAKDAKAMAQLRQIGMAYQMYAADNQDALPTSRDQLIDTGYVTDDLFESPLGESMDEHGSIWLNTRGGKMSDIENPSKYIIAYDRAMFFGSGMVAVAYLDGHVETLDVSDLHEQANMAHHHGIEFNFPY